MKLLKLPCRISSSKVWFAGLLFYPKWSINSYISHQFSWQMVMYWLAMAVILESRTVEFHAKQVNKCLSNGAPSDIFSPHASCGASDDVDNIEVCWPYGCILGDNDCIVSRCTWTGTGRWSTAGITVGGNEAGGGMTGAGGGSDDSARSSGSITWSPGASREIRDGGLRSIAGWNCRHSRPSRHRQRRLVRWWSMSLSIAASCGPTMLATGHTLTRRK